MTRRNWIAVFSEQELRAALSLVATEESASSVAAQLYALAPEEQAYFDWTEGTLLMLSCVSDDVFGRVLEHFTSSSEEMARMEVERARYRESLRAAKLNRRAAADVSLDDVVCDSRKDVTWAAQARAGEAARRGNFIGLFTESEVREALALLGPEEEAASVAAQLYAVPPEEQARLNWTDLALGLLSAVSVSLAERVLRVFGTSPDRATEIREMHDFLRRMSESGELRDPRVHLDLDTVVRGA